MNPDLEPAKEVLRSFYAELETIKKIRQNISAPILTVGEKIPDFSQMELTPAPDSYWEKDDAYTWIYGTPHYHRLLHYMKHLRPIHPFYIQAAKPLFDEWNGLLLDIQNIPRYYIPSPSKHKTLYAYLEQLQSIVIEKKERRKIWWSSLRSFTEFLRKKVRNQIEQLGELDTIFPEEMTIYFDTIIRKVPLTLYPIDIWATADILQKLAHLVFEGRPNSQQSAAQALGLAWVCLVSGNARFMTRLEILHELPPPNIKILKQDDSQYTPDHWMTVRTFFGKIDAPISKTLYDYLSALPQTNPHYIFSQPLRSLRRSLSKAIAMSDQTQNLGKITFYTLMHESHEARGHRYQT